jgi:hypothetical protein
MDQSATGKDYSTVDVEFTHWKREIVKRFFGLIKTKGDYDVKRLPDESGTDIDLGTGMFDIPVEQSVERVISLLKKAEQKVGVGTPTRQMTDDANTDFMDEGFNPLRKMKDFAGEKGWTFSARRPTDEEDAIGREYMESQGKKLGSIGVDRITGNINVMEPNGDFRAILSPDGEELSAYEMDIHEADKEEKSTTSSNPNAAKIEKFMNDNKTFIDKIKLFVGSNPKLLASLVSSLDQKISTDKKIRQTSDAQQAGLNENRESLDKVNELRKVLFATKDLKTGVFAFLEDLKANELLDNLIGYLEEKVKENGGNI